MKDSKTNRLHSIYSAQIILKELLSKLLNDPFSAPKNKNYWRESVGKLKDLSLLNVAPEVIEWDTVAKIISQAYEKLQNLLSYTSCDNNTTVNVNELNIKSSCSTDCGKQLLFSSLKNEWEKNIRNYALGFYVHGSLATDDYTAYSDCDTMIILKKTTVLSAEKLMDFRRIIIPTISILRKYDPYQHHGHFFISEFDMKVYPEVFLPIECYNNAVAIGGLTELVFALRSSERESALSARGLAETIINNRLRINRMSVKYYKNYLSYIMILPSLVLGAKGEFIYKRDSFYAIREFFSDEQWDVIEWASRQRLNWNSRGVYSKIVKIICRCWPSKAAHILMYLDFIMERLPGFDKACRLKHFEKVDEKLQHAIVDFAQRAIQLCEE